VRRTSSRNGLLEGRGERAQLADDFGFVRKKHVEVRVGELDDPGGGNAGEQIALSSCEHRPGAEEPAVERRTLLIVLRRLVLQRLLQRRGAIDRRHRDADAREVWPDVVLPSQIGAVVLSAFAAMGIALG
jgi:hypothetical protein